MYRSRWIAAVAAGAVAFSACGANVEVTTERAEPVRLDGPTLTLPPVSPADDPTVEPAPDDPGADGHDPARHSCR